MKYRRSNIEGGIYFFTVNLANGGSYLLVREIEAVRRYGMVELANQLLGFGRGGVLGFVPQPNLRTVPMPSPARLLRPF